MIAMPDVISSLDIGREWVEDVFGIADAFGSGAESSMLSGRMISLAFFEPSTRTFASFDVAAKKLGMNTTSIRSSGESSIYKGESLSDTVRMLSSYSDCIVLRHPNDGAAKLASQITDKPVINAGDGKHEHPTQSVIDLYTVRKSFGKVDGLTYAIAGDLRYGRAAHSLIYLLTKFNPSLVYLVSPPQLSLRDDYKAYINYEYEECETISDAADSIDVLYVTRVQKERFPDDSEYERVRNSYVVDLDTAEMLKDNAIIMHPLPRVGEIDRAVDSSGKAKYFEQASYGVAVRMAIFLKVIGGRDG